MSVACCRSGDRDSGSILLPSPPCLAVPLIQLECDSSSSWWQHTSSHSKSAPLIVQLINDPGWQFPVQKTRQGLDLYVVQLTMGDSGEMTYLSLPISVSAQWRDNNRIYLMQLFHGLNELTYAKRLEQCLARGHPYLSLR